MTEAEKAFRHDCRMKKVVAASARFRRSHAGKGGKVRLPSDNLTKKELEKMNGECKVYRLNKPMVWEEFKQLPDDMKIAYIKALRETYNAPTKEITKMLGVSSYTYGETLRRLGISEPTGTRRTVAEEWFKWLDGKKAEEPVEENEPVVEDDTCDLADMRPDWEGMYKELHARCCEMNDEIVGLRRTVEKLREENAELMEYRNQKVVGWDYHRKIVDALEKDNEIVRAKLSVVEMIFGNK